MEDPGRNDLELGCYLEEDGDFEQAFNAYLRAAKLGNKEAQVNLANLYDDGKGCIQDTRKAIFWYKKAVKLGCPQAANNIGVVYRRWGKKQWADYWFRRADEMENSL